MNHTLLLSLQSCQTLKSLKSLHGLLFVNGLVASSDLILNKIIRQYFRFGSIDYARKVFDRIPQPNAFLWTSMIHGYVENKQFSEAFSMFFKMHRESVSPLNFTIIAVLKGLARKSRLKDGEAVYGYVLKCGFNFDVMVQNSMLDLLMRSERINLARWVFDDMHEKDIVSWNSMITGYCNNGRIDIARELFAKMPDRNVISWTSIICGYVKAGDMAEAGALFVLMPVKDLAVWNMMVSGYVDNGDLDAALLLFETMPCHNVGTWNLIISGCCKVGKVELARDYFNRMPTRNVVSWTMMIDGFMKSGNVNDARLLFDQMPEKNLITWSTMIRGCAKNGEPRCALELLGRFKEQGIKTDEIFIMGVILACSQLGVLDAAESIISDYVGLPLFSNLHVATSLIDMYAKCGSIDKALRVFQKTFQKDLLCYSTMIAAFANHGLGREAILLFDDMRRKNINPDSATFVGILSACNHGGLVNEGRRYFKQMTEEFGIQPIDKHYACMVDLLGRSGCLEEAHKLICSMKVGPTAVVWGSLLSACSIYCNVELAEAAAAELFKIEPYNSGNYILLSNIYAAAGQWDNVAKVRAMIRKNRVRKNRGSSWIELDSVVYEFVMGDLSHLKSDGIYFILDLLHEELKLIGHGMGVKQKALIPISNLWPSDLSYSDNLEYG